MDRCGHPCWMGEGMSNKAEFVTAIDLQFNTPSSSGSFSLEKRLSLPSPLVTWGSRFYFPPIFHSSSHPFFIEIWSKKRHNFYYLYLSVSPVTNCAALGVLTLFLIGKQKVSFPRIECQDTGWGAWSPTNCQLGTEASS
jgi:hypothetical protein